MKLADNILGAQHLGIPVWNLEEAAKWYEEKCGFTRVYEKSTYIPMRLDIIFLKLKDLVIELYAPVEVERAALKKRGHGVMAHFAIDAPDFTACAQSVYKKGAKLDASTPKGCVLYEHVGPKGVRGVNFVGPVNEVVEVCHDYAVDYAGRTGLYGWSHLALKVHDLKTSLDFYEKLGFVKTADGYLDTPEGRLIIAFISKGGFTMEVIQVPVKEAAEIAKNPVGHIDHMALDVKDAQDALLTCRKMGMKLADSTIKELPLFEKGVRFFMIIGPDGERIELNERRKR